MRDRELQHERGYAEGECIGAKRWLMEVEKMLLPTFVLGIAAAQRALWGILTPPFRNSGAGMSAPKMITGILSTPMIPYETCLVNSAVPKML